MTQKLEERLRAMLALTEGREDNCKISDYSAFGGLTIGDMRALSDALLAEREKVGGGMREALKPFADAADFYDEESPKMVSRPTPPISVSLPAPPAPNQRTSEMGELLCWFGIHRWRPTSWLTCNPTYTGQVCTRCYCGR